MDATITKAEAALFLPDAMPGARRLGPAEANRLAAIAVRDAALATAIRRAVAAVRAAAEGLVRAVLTFPARRETYAALRRLSDRELQDIGMTRFDITRVFDPAFTPRSTRVAGMRPATRA